VYRIVAGARFSAPVQTDHRAHQMGTGSFLGVKRPERGVNSHAYLALRLKKDYSHTSTPPLPSWQVIGYILFFRRVLGWVCLWIRMRKELRTFVKTIMNGFCSRSS